MNAAGADDDETTEPLVAERADPLDMSNVCVACGRVLCLMADVRSGRGVSTNSHYCWMHFVAAYRYARWKRTLVRWFHPEEELRRKRQNGA